MVATLFYTHTILSFLYSLWVKKGRKNASQFFTVSTYLSTILSLLYSLSVKKGRKNASQLFIVITYLSTILSFLYSLWVKKGSKYSSQLFTVNTYLSTILSLLIFYVRKSRIIKNTLQYLGPHFTIHRTHNPCLPLFSAQ